jgi:hypothetical protein
VDELERRTDQDGSRRSHCTRAGSPSWPVRRLLDGDCEVRMPAAG